MKFIVKINLNEINNEIHYKEICIKKKYSRKNK